MASTSTASGNFAGTALARAGRATAKDSSPAKAPGTARRPGATGRADAGRAVPRGNQDTAPRGGMESMAVWSTVWWVMLLMLLNETPDVNVDFCWIPNI